MKRLHVLVLVVLLTSLVIACGQTPATPEEAPAETEQEAVQPTEAPAEEPAEQPTEAPAEEPTEAPAATEEDSEMAASDGQCGFDITIGSNGDGKIVNPILAVDTDGFWRTDMMFDSLVDVDLKTLEPIPHLAKSWEISDDGRTYTFTLTDADVRWHDGEPFTVDDIEYTMMEILKPTYAGIYQSRFAGLVGAEEVIAGDADSLEGFQVIDDKTVQFKLKEPNAAFLAVTINDLKFLPKHLLEGEEITEDMPYSLAPVGTGPYKFESWDKGSEFVMVRNEDYWGEMACPGRITTVVIPDMQSLAAAVETGDIDLTIVPPPTEVPRLAEVDGLTVYQQPSVGAETLWFNLNNEILSDVRVRQAIAHAIDAQAFTEGVLLGTTEPANGIISPGIWAFDPDASMPEYDPELSKELLAEAGYPDGFSIKLSTNQGNFFREQFVTFAQAELAKVGIDVEIETAEWGTFIGNVIDGNYEMRFHNANGGIPDPDLIRDSLQTGAGNNYSDYSNADVDQWLEEARVTSDIEARKELYSEVVRQSNEDLVGVHVFWRPNPLVTRSVYENVTPSAFHSYGGIHKWRLAQ